MSANMLTTEAELRHAVIDRLISASLNEGKPAREEILQRWRDLKAKPSAKDEAHA